MHIEKIKKFAMAEEPCKFVVKMSTHWTGILNQHAYFLKGFSQQNLRTGEELVLTRLSATNFLLRRCPIGTEEKEWHPIVEEIDSIESEFGNIQIFFRNIGYFNFL